MVETSKGKPKIYVNDDSIKKWLSDLALTFHENPVEIKDGVTLAVVLKFLDGEGRKDYSDVYNVISDCTDKAHVPVIVLDDKYSLKHSSEVWLRRNVIRYLPLDDTRTREGLKTLLFERLRSAGRVYELTAAEKLDVGWSVKIDPGQREKASLVSLFVGSMGRFMVDLKTLLDMISPEAKRQLDESKLKPDDFLNLNLEKLLEIKRALNIGKDSCAFEGGTFSKDQMLAAMRENNAGALFERPPFTNRSHIIIEGETGTGKTLIARFIHDYVYGEEHKGKLEKVNCANIAETVTETQLFGSLSGAFTDARTRPGAIMRAYHGTVFLDEVGELSPVLQARLLSYLDTQTIMPDGWYGDPIYVPSLVVAATNRVLAAEVERGVFRRDLHHRLGFTVRIPPLRERLSDLERLVDFVLQNPMVYDGPRNLDSVLSYTWEQKGGGPSGEFKEEAHAVI